jgi:hypothetical protein
MFAASDFRFEEDKAAWNRGMRPKIQQWGLEPREKTALKRRHGSGTSLLGELAILMCEETLAMHESMRDR